MHARVELPTWLVIVRLAMETTSLVLVGIRAHHTHCEKVASKAPGPKYPENANWGCCPDPGQSDISLGNGNDSSSCSTLGQPGGAALLTWGGGLGDHLPGSWGGQ
jgi:hypothetical protein